LRTANTWFSKTPERALDEAFDAASMIKAIEDEHFNGGKISENFGNYGESVQTYFQQELKRYLNIIKVRLAEFNLSRSVLRISTRPITEIQLNQDSTDLQKINVIDKPAATLRKLRFIDEVLARYQATTPQASSLIVVSESPNTSTNGANSRRIRKRTAAPNTNADIYGDPDLATRAEARPDDIESIVDKTGVLPRSILKTVDRIKRELDPKAEEEVVENFRSSKARTIISIRLILLLIIVPVLTQQLAKIALAPIIDPLRAEQVQIFLNEEMEEEAFAKLQQFKERLEFQVLTHRINPLTEEEREERLEEKAEEITAEFREISNDAIKNIFADICSVFAFVVLILHSKREIGVLKSFIDELVYGLSDSAKAFIIILLTDTFVGFHSPHGWEVLLEGVSRHLGLPANRDFIFLFIATFPVILDTIFKYWIFRYLNRISPSAVATYRNMNE
jgi:hypothetical protein